MSPECGWDCNLECQPFLTNEDAHCMWDSNLGERNIAYLNSIDPMYFQYIARVHEPYLDGEDKQKAQYAALSIRTTYSHALETFFALLSSALQNPECAIGWMLRYKNQNLTDLVGNIHHRRRVQLAFDLPRINWQEIAKLVVCIANENGEADTEKQELFGRLWGRLAHDFLDEHRNDEYNSIKHGLRVSGGGFTLAMGMQIEPGVPALAENMRSFGGSEFGSTYYSVEPVSDQFKFNFQVRKQNLNWSPHNLLAAIDTLCWSIGNVVSFLKLHNKISLEDIWWYFPVDVAAFDTPWVRTFSIHHVSMDTQLNASTITPLTRDQIRAACCPVVDSNDQTPVQ